MQVRHSHLALTQIRATIFGKHGRLDSYLVPVDERLQLFGSHRLASEQQVGNSVHLAIVPILCVW